MKSKSSIKFTIFPVHSSAVSSTSYAAIPQKSFDLTKHTVPIQTPFSVFSAGPGSCHWTFCFYGYG